MNNLNLNDRYFKMLKDENKKHFKQREIESGDNRAKIIPLTIGLVFFLLLMLWVCVKTVKAEVSYTNEQIANAIFKAENSIKYPYGIKSINTYGNKEYARKICLNTIRNNRKRFTKQTKYDDFIVFLGSRYCPPKAHRLNIHWVRNVKYYLAKEV